MFGLNLNLVQTFSIIVCGIRFYLVHLFHLNSTCPICFVCAHTHTFNNVISSFSFVLIRSHTHKHSASLHSYDIPFNLIEQLLLLLLLLFSIVCVSVVQWEFVINSKNMKISCSHTLFLFLPFIVIGIIDVGFCHCRVVVIIVFVQLLSSVCFFIYTHIICLPSCSAFVNTMPERYI